MPAPSPKETSKEPQTHDPGRLEALPVRQQAGFEFAAATRANIRKRKAATELRGFAYPCFCSPRVQLGSSILEIITVDLLWNREIFSFQSHLYESYCHISIVNARWVGLILAFGIARGKEFVVG